MPRRRDGASGFRAGKGGKFALPAGASTRHKSRPIFPENMKRLIALATATFTIATAFAADPPKGWSFSDGKGYRSLNYYGATVLRHMNEWDPARRDETFKPYTHVFDFGGGEPITKGPGGQFTHHRGMFIGWNKVGFDGKSYDFWHCKNVIRKHTEYVTAAEKTGLDSGTMVSVTEWPTPEGKVVVKETQTITATKPAEGKLVLDVSFKLEAPNGPVTLNGDVQHAGFHFRAAEEVNKRQKETVYIMPEGATKKGGDVFENCNWVVCQFNLGEKRYAVAHFNDPANATPLQYSTRAYGRFGAFSKTEITTDKPLTLRYQVIVTDVAKVPPGDASAWQKQWDAFAKK